MTGDTEYSGTCDVCYSQLQVSVLDEEETPSFCPMCGSEMEFEVEEDDNDYE
jgi:rRNA maturation endonuclease Nob1